MKTKIKFIPNKIHVKKEDKVIVISGKDKGIISKVIKSFPKTGKIIVDGVNIKTKHIKSNKDLKGKIIKVASPIFSSKVMFYSEDNKSPTKLGRKLLTNGNKVRFMKKFKEII